MLNNSLKENAKAAFNIPQSAKVKLQLLIQKTAAQRIAAGKDDKNASKTRLSSNPLRVKLLRAFRVS